MWYVTEVDCVNKCDINEIRDIAHWKLINIKYGKRRTDPNADTETGREL